MPLFVKEPKKKKKNNTSKTNKTKQTNRNKYKMSVLWSTSAMVGNSNHLDWHEVSHSFAD